MKIFLTLTLYSSLLTTAVAQYNPKDHNAINGKKEIVFHDNFDDDRNDWFTLYSSPERITDNNDSTTGKDSSVISNGFFRFATTGTNNKVFKGHEIISDIDYSRNFEISLKVKVGKQKDKPGTGVIYWGREMSTFNGYNMYIQQDAKLIFFYSNDKIKEFVDVRSLQKKKAKKAIYHKDDFNTYTIRKYDDWYYVFINGTFSFSCKAVPTNGKILGLGGVFNATTLFDYLTITYLP